MSNRFAATVSCLLAACLAVAYGADGRAVLQESRSLSLPAHAVLDESAEPVLSSDGRVGFISSVTGGFVLAFSATTGRTLTSMVVGENVGPVTMRETGRRRLVAVSAGNDPGSGHPATITILDATKARSFEIEAMLVLPEDARLTPSTRALLTDDGRYCLVASSFENATLFVFETASGSITARMPLAGTPTEMVLHGRGSNQKLAVAFGDSLTLMKFENGFLYPTGSFDSGATTAVSASNNPAFSSDGQFVYFAVAAVDQLFVLESRTGVILDRISVMNPHRVTVGSSATGADLVGVTRIRRPVSGTRGGVIVYSSRDGRLAFMADFTPPDHIDISRSNNVAFGADGAFALVGSRTGMLFAFSTESGELGSFQLLGKELRRIALTSDSRTVAAVRSADSGDQVVLVRVGVGESEAEPVSPAITSLKPDAIEQGQRKDPRVRVLGENFTEGATLVVNGVEVAAALIRNGRELEARLPSRLFAQPGRIAVQVRNPDGAVSQAAMLRVVRPLDPVIDGISPVEVPGPSAAFRVTVRGKNFRSSSAIVVGDRPLSTERISDKRLTALVPEDLGRFVGRLTVEVRDLAVPDVVSNGVEIDIFGPLIEELRAGRNGIVAGGAAFGLRIIGRNFRLGASVEFDGARLPDNRTQRVSSRLLRVRVPARFIEEAGEHAVVVRNPEGAASEPGTIEALPPSIVGFEPGQLLAGRSEARLVIRSRNLLGNARVFLADDFGRAMQLPRKQVNVRLKSSQIVVNLSGELGVLLSQPGDLRFQIVNPNGADGIASEIASVKVAGPEIEGATITRIEGDNRFARLVVTGANFRRGAFIEFVQGDMVFRTQIPDRRGGNKLTVRLRKRFLDNVLSLGLQIRIVNPGQVRSEPASPVAEEIARN